MPGFRVLPNAECTEAIVCDDTACTDEALANGRAHLPDDLRWTEGEAPLCHAPTTIAGSQSTVVALVMPAVGLLLLAAAIRRGAVVRELTRRRRAMAAVLGASTFGLALAWHGRISPVHWVRGHVFVVAAIAATAILAGWLATRAVSRAAGWPSVAAAALLPLVPGAVVAEYTRATNAHYIAWLWSSWGFITRARSLAEDVDEMGAPWVVGLAGTATVFVAAAIVDAADAPPIRWPRALGGAALLGVAYATAFARSLGVGPALALVLALAVGFLARGARPWAVVAAVTSIGVVAISATVRDAVGMIGWEDGWPDRLAWIARATWSSEWLPLVVAASATFVVLSSSARDPAPSRADPLRSIVALAAVCFLSIGPLRMALYVTRIAGVASRFAAAAADLDAPRVVDSDHDELAPDVFAVRASGVTRANLDDDEAWTEAPPATPIQRALPTLVAMRGDTTVDAARARMAALRGPLATMFLLVRTDPPPVGRLATAFVGAPIRSIPIVFAIDPEQLDEKLRHAVVVRPIDERTFAVTGQRNDTDVVPSSAVAATVAAKCRFPSAMNHPNPLLFLVVPGARTLNEVLALTAQLLPQLDFMHFGGGGVCRFRALALEPDPLHSRSSFAAPPQ